MRVEADPQFSSIRLQDNGKDQQTKESRIETNEKIEDSLNNILNHAGRLNEDS